MKALRRTLEVHLDIKQGALDAYKDLLSQLVDQVNAVEN
jgi:hypothetical protein